MVVALLAALATAGAAVAVEGSLQANSLDASGFGAVLAEDPILAARSRSGGMEFVLEDARGVLEREWAPEAGLYVPVLPGRVWGNTFEQLRQEETVPLDGALIRSTFARAESVVLVWSEGTGVLSRTLPDAGFRAQASEPVEVHSHAGAPVDVNGEAFFWREIRSVQAPHVNLTLPHGAFEAEGPLAIYLFNVDFAVEQGGTTTAYRTGTTTEQDGGALRGERVEKAVLRLTSGRLALRTLHEMELRAAEAEIHLDGALVLTGASGALRGEGATWRADGAARLDGPGTYRLSPAPGGRSALDAAPRALLLGVEGDPSLIGFSVIQDPTAILPLDAATAAGAAAGGGALLLAVLGAVAWRRRQAAPQPEGLVEAAVLRLEAGDHGGALALFNEALAREPRNPTLHLDRAHCLDRLGRVAESRRAYELAVRFAPESGEAHYQLARSLAGSGLAPSAIAHLSRAFSLDPAYAQAAREEPAFRAIQDHPTYADLDRYYRRAA